MWPRMAGLLLVAASAMVAAPCRAETPALTVSPQTVAVGTFSATARLRIAGRMAPGSDVIVVVRGRDVNDVFNRQGRFGFIWIAAGKVQVSGVPALFLAFSQEPIASMLPRATIDDFLLDERALVAHMQITPREADRPEIRDSYLSLKVDEGNYQSLTKAFELAAPVDGQIPFALDLVWPLTAPPGPYRALAYECRSGQIVGRSSASFDVVESGFAAGMKHLADDHGAQYGALAVGVMMSLGFGLDFVVAWVRRRRSAGRRKQAEALVREDAGIH
jgi:hypothetical protein